MDARPRLDRIDRQILQELQHDGRLSAQGLSERVHLSPRACLDRIRRLEQDGYIHGYRALIDRRRLGSSVSMFAQVTLVDQRSTTRSGFEARIARTDEVTACWLVGGEFDYLMRLVCADLPHYHRLTDAWIDDLAMGVARVVSLPELASVKEAAGVPVALLQDDGPRNDGGA